MNVSENVLVFDSVISFEVLALVAGSSEEDVDHCRDYSGCFVDCGEACIVESVGWIWAPVLVDILDHEPFAENEAVHPSEEEKKKHNLRDEFEEEVHKLAKVEGVASLKADTN